MELHEALQALDLLQKKLYAYTVAENSLYLDSATTAPKKSGEGRGVALEILASEYQKLMTNAQTEQLITYLETQKDNLSFEVRRQVEILAKDLKRMKVIPEDEYSDYARLLNDAGDVWHEAKEKSDFDLFAPYLEKIVQYNQKFAGYYDSTKAPYDALLNEYETGVTMEYLDKFFKQLREDIVPLIKAIGNKPQVRDDFLTRFVSKDKQKEFSDYLMEIMSLSKDHCAIGETEHPFTLEFNNKDVRITTNYNEYAFVENMYSVIHEGGHARYELDIRDDLQYTVVTGGVSMGIHESQSRFYENIIGRSESFVKAIYPKMKEFFKEQLADVSEEELYRGVNKVEPSLVRTEADELTYSLHVMVRYEIEKKLIDGSLAVKDIPSTWNQLYKEYLGIDVPDDKHGCLQDSHWSGGGIGYFPSYALGSAYGAQMLAEMEKEMDVWSDVAKGDLSKVTEWLKVHIHQYGKLYEADELLKRVIGEFDASYYTNYLKEKYTKIYNL